MPSDDNHNPGGIWPGRLTDGRSARSHEVDVSLAADGIVLRSRHADLAPAVWLFDGLAANVPLKRGVGEVVLSPRAIPGATLHVADEAFVRALASAAPALGVRAVRMEGLKPGIAVGAMVFALTGAVYAFDLSPSKGIASLMPAKARSTLGERVLATLPVKTVCEGEKGRAALKTLIERLAPGEPRADERVVVLDWTIMNAFAVPGGRVVLTRTIIQRAASADELAGVIAHEIGHGAELHPESGLVRSVGFWALIQMVFTGTPGAIGNAGTMLAQLAYSRTAEREADDFALAMLKRADISPKPFAGLFRRIDTPRSPPPTVPSTGRVFTSDLFSTHPASPERIAKIEAAPTYPSRPALSEQQWQDLREICGPSLVVPPPPMSDANAPSGSSPPPAPAAQDIDRQIAMVTAQIGKVPTDPFPHRQRGLLYLRKDMTREALLDLDRAVELAPRNAGYRNDRGNVHFRLRDYARAEEDYSESIKLNPQAHLPRAARGVVYRLQKRFDAAHADFNSVLADNPTNEYALLNRGLTYRDQERWADARRDLDAVIARNAKHPAAFAFRGQVLEKLGERDKAIADYRSTLVTPGATNAALARARLAALGVTP